MFKVINSKAPLPVLLILLSLVLALSACTPKKPLPGDKGGRGTYTDHGRPPAKATLPNAKAAYQAGNMAEAERMALTVLREGNLGVADQINAWRIAAFSSQANGNYSVTMRALENWRALSPGADSTEEWYTAWYRALEQMPAAEATAEAQKVISDPGRSKELVTEARLFGLESRMKKGNTAGLGQGLESVYNSLPGTSGKKNLEQRIFSQLHEVSPKVLANLLKITDEANEKRFPYALIRLEDARRMYLDPNRQAFAKEYVAFIKEDTTLADTSVFNSWSSPDSSVVSRVPVRTKAIAFVLPMSGQYGNLSGKIMAGAEIARKEFAKNGNDLQIYLVDSDKSDWLNRVAALPREVQVVGGPLRLSDYETLKNAGQTSNRFFFGFLPRISDGDEGVRGWRYFSTPDDQLGAVIKFARELGITHYGAFIPEEDYGYRMLQLYTDKVQESGNLVVKSGTYPVKQHQLWNKRVAEFLNTTKEAPTAPDTFFQALYLPDSWKEIPSLVPHFFYYRENRLLLLGSSLWEQGLGAITSRIDARYYRLAIFPGSWDPNSITPAGMTLRSSLSAEDDVKPDFWVSLGYDFLTVAATLSLTPDAKAGDLNRALGYVRNLPLSGAPVFWDQNGVARQELFIFTPTENGFTKADPAVFKRRFTKAWEPQPVKTSSK